MVKVIHIIADLSFGGAGRYLFNVLKYFDREKYQVEVICHGKGQLYEKLLRETDIKTHLVSPTTKAKSFSIEILKGVYRILKNEKPHIVHVHASLAGRIAAKALGIKVVLTKHWRQNKGFPLLNKATANILTDRIIAVSQSVAISLREAGISEKMITVIYNGIDVTTYRQPALKDYKKIWNIEDKKVIGIVGRLEPEKDHETFLKAAKILCEERDDVHFVIAGKGSKEQELKDLAKRLGICDDITFAGFLPDIRDAVEAFDISVLTSTNEAFGLVLAESMILGKPVVATNLDSIYEVVGDGGVFFDVGDYEALADALLSLIDDPSIGESLGAIGKNRVLNMFDAGRMVSELEEVYEEILCR